MSKSPESLVKGKLGGNDDNNKKRRRAEGVGRGRGGTDVVTDMFALLPTTSTV